MSLTLPLASNLSLGRLVFVKALEDILPKDCSCSKVDVCSKPDYIQFLHDERARGDVSWMIVSYLLL